MPTRGMFGAWDRWKHQYFRKIYNKNTPFYNKRMNQQKILSCADIVALRVEYSNRSLKSRTDIYDCTCALSYFK